MNRRYYLPALPARVVFLRRRLVRTLVLAHSQAIALMSQLRIHEEGEEKGQVVDGKDGVESILLIHRQ